MCVCEYAFVLSGTASSLQVEQSLLAGGEQSHYYYYFSTTTTTTTTTTTPPITTPASSTATATTTATATATATAEMLLNHYCLDGAHLLASMGFSFATQLSHTRRRFVGLRWGRWRTWREQGAHTTWEAVSVRARSVQEVYKKCTRSVQEVCKKCARRGERGE